MTVVLGRAGRLVALGAVGLLSLLLAAAEPRAVTESLGVDTAVDQYVVRAAAVDAAPAPRVKPSQAAAPKRTALAAAAAGVGAALVFFSTLLGAVPAARHARRLRWRQGGIRAPPTLLPA